MSLLSSKVIAITGASAGIGRACAERLARDGAAVVLSARRAVLLDEVARAIADRGGRALAVPGDVTNPDDMRALVTAAVQRFGRLDVMICNAGIGFHGALAESTPDVARRLFDVNVFGTIYAALAAHEVFAKQQAGHIIAMSSIAGVRGLAGTSLYSATKAAQVAFIESLRTEFVGSDLHASVVYPVSTPTEFRKAMRRDFGQAVEGRGPRQTAEDVANAVARCIVSPKAEVYPYRYARWLAVATVIAPAWTDRFIQRFDRRRQRRQQSERA